MFRKKLMIQEGSISVKISGNHTPFPFGEREVLKIYLEFSGLNKADSSLLAKKISFQGSAYDYIKSYTILNTKGSNYVIRVEDNHVYFSDLKYEEFIAHLDSMDAIICIDGIFEKPYNIFMEVDKEKMIKLFKMRK